MARTELQSAGVLGQEACETICICFGDYAKKLTLTPQKSMPKRLFQINAVASKQAWLLQYYVFLIVVRVDDVDLSYASTRLKSIDACRGTFQCTGVYIHGVFDKYGSVSRVRI